MQYALDTVPHLLLRCPHFDSERYVYLASRGPELTRLGFLLFASEALEPLFEFLKATARFTNLLS
jgi:hypothetical protein